MNLEAVERTIGELRRLGRLEEIDTARVELLRSLARALDDEPHSPGLYREYRSALSEVLEADDDVDDSLEAELAKIRGATSVGDAETS